MDQKDYLIITKDKYKELRKRFKEIWDNEPSKLNAFIDGEEFCLNDFNLVLMNKLGYNMTVECYYAKSSKKFYFTDDEHGYQGEVKNPKIITDVYSSHYLAFKTDNIISYKDKKSKELLWGACQEQGFKPVDYVVDLLTIFLIINIIVSALPEKIKKKTEKATRTIEKKTKKGKVYKSVVYLKNIYIIDDDFKLTKSETKHIIKCPAWGVRGHYRHTKNGVVFVKPYVKGKYRKDANKYVSKEYRV